MFSLLVISLFVFLNLVLMFRYAKTISFKVLACIFSGMIVYMLFEMQYKPKDSIDFIAMLVAAPLTIWIFSFVSQWVLIFLGWYYKPENVKKRQEKRNYELQQKLLKEAERQNNLPKCKWCGTKHDNNSSYCSTKCFNEYQAKNR